MSFTVKSIRQSSLLGALVLAAAAIGQAAQAHPTPVAATPALQAASISSQRAEAIALQAVGGGPRCRRCSSARITSSIGPSTSSDPRMNTRCG